MGARSGAEGGCLFDFECEVVVVAYSRLGAYSR